MSAPEKADLSTASRWSGFSKEPIDKVLIAGLVSLVPLIIVQALNLWGRQHLQFFPLAWIAFAFVVIKYGELGSCKSTFRTMVGVLQLALSVLFFLLGVLAFSPWMAQISLICLLLGWILLRFGSVHWNTIIIWIGLLVVTLPLPMNLDERLIQLLQIRSSQSASFLLDLLGIQHLLLGNVIEVRNGRLFVDQACSGVDSFYALCAITLILVVWRKRSFLISAIQLLIVPFWAWLGNVLRLVIITYCYDQFDLNLLHGWQHTLLGMVTFAFAFTCMITTHQLIYRILSPLPTGRHNASWAHQLYNSFVRWPKKSKGETAVALPIEPDIVVIPRWYAIFSVFVSLALVCLGVVSLGPILMVGPWKQVVVQIPNIDRGMVEATFEAGSVPQNFGNLVRTGFKIEQRERDDLFGEYSSTWFFQDGSRPVVVSLDFPFPSFHALEVCYQLTGSQIVDSMVDVEFDTTTGRKYIRHGELMDEFNERSHIYYMEFTPSGFVDKASRTLWERLVPRQLREPLFQAQLVVKNAGTLSEADNERYLKLLLESQELFLPLIQSMK